MIDIYMLDYKLKKVAALAATDEAISLYNAVQGAENPENEFVYRLAYEAPTFLDYARKAYQILDILHN